MEVIWRREWLLYDLANLCSAMAQSSSRSKETAVLQMLCDVCQKGNVDRMSRVFQLSMSEIRREIVSVKRWREVNKMSYPLIIDNTLDEDDFSIELGDVSIEDAKWIRDTVQDFLVIAAITDWLNVVVGAEEALHWEERSQAAFEKALDAIFTVGSKSPAGVYERKLSPI